MKDGTRVRDVDTGRVGTVQIGWATGALSIVWDDDPGVAEHGYEGTLECALVTNGIGREPYVSRSAVERRVIGGGAG